MDNRLTPEEMDRIEGEAAEWVLVMDEGSLSDDTLAQWRQWIDRSVDHRDSYEKMLQLWSVADELPEDMGDNQASGLPNKQNVENVVPFFRKPSSWLWGGMATAAALLLTVFVLLPQKNTVPAVKLGDVTGFQTAVNQHSSYTLPDGSVIELGADSLVHLAFDDKERRITLARGEASFDVAKNPDRPFVVAAGAGRYRALGTVFNVEMTKDQSTLTVVEGIVQARLQSSDINYNGSNYPRLVAGEAVSVSAAGDIGNVRQVDAAAATAWRTGQLVFVDQPLAQVFERMNRYRHKPVVVSDNLSQLRYTGSVHRDSMDTMLELLPEVFSVAVVKESGAIYIVPR